MMEKHQYMRSFISAAAEYTKHPSEATVSVLQRNLGAIGFSVDLSMFDPGSSIAAEFYVSLHELMTILGSRTPLIWSALDVLQNACRNSAARQALIHTYKFAPILTRLLETNLTLEKRIKVLKLLQELTYGVKLSWQEAHLPYLISTLTQWVMQSKDEDVMALSLGILVNLCYKNLPAVYTLMRTVDTKIFLRTLLKIQSQNVNTRVQCCKMMIILETDNKNISEKKILEFVATTFTSLISALKQRDAVVLQHIVEFFNDVVKQNEYSKSLILNYETYTNDVEKILRTIESTSDPECVSLVMEFLLSLFSLKLTTLVSLYPVCVKVAMGWIPVEQVCSKALALIRTVVIDSRRMENPIDVLSDLDLSMLMLVVKCDDEDDRTKGTNESKWKDQRSVESESRLTELMQLLQEMARISTLKIKVMQAFNEQAMRKLFRAMLEQNDSSCSNRWPGNLFNDPATALYIHALALTADHAAYDSTWLTLYSELLQKKQVQMIMALALYTAGSEVKQKVLQLTSSVGFPQECVSSVANCMSELEPLILVQNSNGAVSTMGGIFPTHGPIAEMTPLFSFNQESRLDAFLVKLEEAFNGNQIGDITTSAVMELYDYKLAAMRHAERATQASLEAANNHATSLQHRLAQIVAESSRLHQLLFNNQQCLEGVRAEKVNLTATIQAQARKIEEIPKLKKIVSEKSAAIERGSLANAALQKELEASSNKVDEFGKKITKLEAEMAEAALKFKETENKRSELKKMFVKLQETVNKKEQIIEEREREIAQNRETISALKQEIDQLGKQCRSYEQTIAEKEESVQRMMSELKDLSHMRDMIYQLTAKKKSDESNTTT
ncbi:uncharacterized protein [Venturia canescens]|uniref:uncharacterized protein n=1 Tax=Venturia canescens TaxID=32260 RepID=UPI001C9D52F6|nr:uncharacterized protein LOC122408908 [Venturia canescens]